MVRSMTSFSCSFRSDFRSVFKNSKSLGPVTVTYPSAYARTSGLKALEIDTLFAGHVVIDTGLSEEFTEERYRD